MVNQFFTVSGLTCDACVKLVKKRLEKISGVSRVEIVRDSQRLSISSETEIGESELNEALVGTDYKITA